MENGEIGPAPPIDSVRVFLRVVGETLDPEEVSALLGALPSESHRKGDRIEAPHPHEAATGSWVLESAVSPSAEIEEHIEAILDRLTRDPDEWASLTDRFSADICCGLQLGAPNEGFDISPRLARRLAKRGLALSFDILAPPAA